MLEMTKPTYLIRDIAGVSKDMLDTEGIGGIVFTHARGILTPYENPDWVVERPALQKLGDSGVKFYLLANGQPERDIFKRWHNHLDFEEVIDVSERKKGSVVPTGLERIIANRAELLAVGNWLYSDILPANRAGYRTALMAERNGPRGMHMTVKHPLETAFRTLSGLPIRSKDFPSQLTKVNSVHDSTATIE